MYVTYSPPVRSLWKQACSPVLPCSPRLDTTCGGCYRAKSSKITSWGLLKVVEKSSKNRRKIHQKSIKNPPKSHLGALLGPLEGLLEVRSQNYTKIMRIWLPPGSHLGAMLAPKNLFYVKKFSKRRLGRARGAIFEVSKNKLNIEGSWDRFSIDFWRVLAPRGRPKCEPRCSGNEILFFRLS